MKVNKSIINLFSSQRCTKIESAGDSTTASKIAHVKQSHRQLSTTNLPLNNNKNRELQRQPSQPPVETVRNRTFTQSQSGTGIQQQRAQLLEQRSVLTRNLAELTTQTANVHPSEVREQTVSTLQIALLTASEKEQSFGALYNSIIKEEHDMQFGVLASKGLKDHYFKNPSADECAMAQKNACEKKIAIIDFCLKVLRLNEQAEWTPPSNTEYMLPNMVATPINADRLLEKCLSETSSIPLFKSANGICQRSGLYHEKQYTKSGSCALHANNHYLASWCQRENKTFLPLTARRFALIVEGLINRRTTAQKELIVMNLQTGMDVKEAINRAKQALTQEEQALGDSYSEHLTFNTVVRKGEVYDTMRSGAIRADHITDVVNELYGLTLQQVYDAESALHWFRNRSTLLELEKTHDSIGCGYRVVEANTGHAIAFNKKNGVWYLQDSNLALPIPCSPSKFIDYIMQYPAKNENVSEDLIMKNYCTRKKLNSTSLIRFCHYE